MSNIVTAALTAFFGVVVYVFGQIFQNFLLKPIQKQRDVLGRIAYIYVFYANISYTATPTGQLLFDPKEVQEAKRTMRKLASELRASLHSIPLYGLWARLHIIPSRQDVIKITGGLVGWSNSLSNSDIQPHRKALEDILKLRD